MSINDNIFTLYVELAYEFASTLIGDGKLILEDRNNNNLNNEKAFHIITAKCNGRILKVINGKTVYPNWFLDPTKIPSTGKFSSTHYVFKKAMYDILKERIGQDHNIFVNYVIVDKEEKIYAIHFYHHVNKKNKNIWFYHESVNENGQQIYKTKKIKYISAEDK